MGLLDFGNVEKLLSRFDPLEFYPGQCSRERDRLSACQECVRICPRWAITFSPALQVDLTLCDGCGLCADVCPEKAITVSYGVDTAAVGRRRALKEDRWVLCSACGSRVAPAAMVAQVAAKLRSPVTLDLCPDCKPRRAFDLLRR